jgi:hypothetical protein
MQASYEMKLPGAAPVLRDAIKERRCKTTSAMTQGDAQLSLAYLETEGSVFAQQLIPSQQHAFFFSPDV